jgi:hypothetical protein
MVLETVNIWFKQNAFKVYFKVTKMQNRWTHTIYVFTIKGISVMKLWKHSFVEFCASLYTYHETWNSKIMLSMNYIPTFVNSQVFGGIIFNKLVIKCFWSFKPSLTMKYFMPTFRNIQKLFHHAGNSTFLFNLFLDSRIQTNYQIKS